ncbi:MAG: NOP58 family protein [Candidatus Caldarchaeum sp.]|nr:NOP58 family protein [Candidatus Caldarchaeum sp.]
MARAFVLLTAAGLAVLDENLGYVMFKPFAKQPAEIARIVQSGEMPTGFVEEFLRDVKGRGFDVLLYWDERVGVSLRTAAEQGGVGLQPVERIVFDVEAAMPGAEAEKYRGLVKEVSTELARQRIITEAARRDLHIVHAVRALDDLEKARNQIYVRVKEWYSVHFPELASIVDDVDAFLKVVAAPLQRHDFDEKTVADFLKPEWAAKAVEAAAKSVGGGLSSRDAASLSALASLGLELGKLCERMADYIRELMASEAPNLSAVAGPVLGSRLISLAGGLENLARLPASTIQVIGAEKALFRFLKTGRGAPKHGVIFQHPFVHSAPKWQRGKIARVLATKVSIAARIDYFSKEDRSSQLREALEKRVDEIRRKYASPPKREAPKAFEPVRRRRRR